MESSCRQVLVLVALVGIAVAYQCVKRDTGYKYVITSAEGWDHCEYFIDAFFVVSKKIQERATATAEFNKAYNGIAQIKFSTSSLRRLS